jgi:hypothetical protein
MTIRKIALAQVVLLTAILLSTPAHSGDTEDRVKNLLTSQLDNPRVEVQVLPLPDNRIGVTLKGEVESLEERDRLVDLAGQVKSGTHEILVFDRLTVRAKRPIRPLQEDELKTDIWPLTYIRSRVTPTGTDVSPASGTGTPAPDNIDLLVSALDQVYGSPGQPAVQRAGSNRLVLRGSRETVIALKRLLALADAPWPQVQMNLWAVQVTGHPAEIARRVEEIATQVRRTRDRMQQVQSKLADIVTGPDDAGQTAFLREQFEIAGIDLDPEGPLSLNESLILLILHPNRQGKVTALQRFADALREEMQEEERAGMGFGLEEHVALQRRRIEELRRRRMGWHHARENRVVPFKRLVEILTQNTYESDVQGFAEFGEALACFKNENRSMHRPDAPRRLLRTGATVDRQLKAVMDAFAADMTDLFLDPLLQRVQSIAPLDRDDGVSLVGRTRIVVTSGLEARLDPEMELFVETTRPKPFTQELLNRAFPTTETGTTAAGGAPTGADRVLAGLTSSQALLLAAALTTEVEPTYTTVAPGIGVHVRPTVLPDGGAARLAIDARFGVSSTPQAADNTADTWRQAPADGIVSHNVRTDAAVTAFDLFEISSFSVTASHPQAPFYVPILGRLPVIGRAFQLPRRNKETHFESLVLVNTVILPRSLELHRFYGRDDVFAKESRDLECHEAR